MMVEPIQKAKYIKIVIIAAVVLSVAAVVVLNFRKSKHADNEVAAIASLNAISTAMKSWYISQTPLGYSGASLPALATRYPSYIDDELGKGIKEGYSFMMFPPMPYSYFCIAAPLSEGTSGSRTFRVTNSGIVEVETAEGWRPVK